MIKKKEVEEIEEDTVCDLLEGFLWYFDGFEDKVTKTVAILSWAIDHLAREIGEEGFADHFNEIIYGILGERDAEEFRY